MVSEEAQQADAFIEAVRELYQQHYAHNPHLEGDHDEPYTIGTVLVCLAVSHLDGATTNVTLYAGSWIEALGLAVTAESNLVPEMGDDDG